MDLGGSRALVTGAALRVGRAIARELARAGADLLLHHRSSADAARELAGEIRGLGRDVVLLRGDLSDPDDLRRVAEAGREADLLVNSAAVFPRTPLPEVTVEDWDRVLSVNLRAPFFLARTIGLAMKERGGGAVVNIADWAAYRPYTGYLPYCVSKAGLLAMTAGLARALAPEVRVNAVAPGPVLLPPDMPEAERRAVIGTTPLRREGSPEDVARAVRFLAADASFSTGAVLTVDGGRLIA